ncbi:MAG: N-acetyltransferase [Spirochaetales bacterium]|nr:MAG: N-acetyltransferase [Spirochaetales bacterium]
MHSKRLHTTVGTCCLMSIDTPNGSAEIGSIWCGTVARGTEVITSTVLQLLVFLFDGLGYRRVVWKCDVTNTPSARAAEALGFIHEGIFRNHMVIKGRSRDTTWYSIVDTDWPSALAHLQGRLAGKTRHFTG